MLKNKLEDFLDVLYEFDVKKKLVILKILEQNNSWTSLSELTLASSYSKSTVLKYLVQIKEEAEDETSFSLLTDDQNCYYLELKNSFDFGQYYRGLIFEMWPTQLINDLITSNSINKIQFITKHFISESAFKSKIKQIKVILSFFSLKLYVHNGIYYLRGNEANIRRLATEFYWEFFKGASWPFKVVDETIILEKVNSIEDKTGIPFSLMDRKKLHYQLAILELRYKKGFFFRLSPLLSSFLPVLSKLQWDLQFPISFFPSRDEQNYFYFWLSTESKYFDYFNVSLNNEAFTLFKKEPLITVILKNIDYMDNKIFSLSAEKKEFLKIQLLSIFINITLFENIQSINPNELIYKESYTLKTHLDELLTITNQEIKLTVDTKKFLYYRYRNILLSTYSISIFEKNLIVSFCTDLEPLIEKKLLNILNLYFQDISNVSFISGVKFTDENIDLVVHTGLSSEEVLKKNVNDSLYLDTRYLYNPNLPNLLNILSKRIDFIRNKH
ncbi:helix-turn-helix domain-containing protein [Candidatus Enterococcus ferrettii]|uniref:Mga helix-turn-helix domain-containing protein n=1 Tax=Candidatus Enterococcus ferrettii TaxID=2815324 RepID=A0ABV0EKR1_9ENTE|nr:helix-turn-helix domain-containing protein [Enterococcus sp. 665A]MBO1340903.1 helix-turn-helix domain-containing protein [Enterococcus sp. 665A]